MPQLIIGLIMLLIGVGVTTRKEKQAKKMRSLDTLITVNSKNADMAEMIEKKIQILYDGKPINSYSQISIELYNFADEPFADVPVFIEIIPDGNDSLKSIETEVYGTNGLPEKIIESKDDLKHTVKGSLKYKYIIKNAEVSSEQPILTANYFIIGNKKPTVKVDIDKLGVSLQEYDPSHYDKTPWYQTENFYIGVVFGFYILFVFGVVKILNYFQERRNKRLGEYVRNSFADKLSNGQLFNDAEKIVTEYKKISESFDYTDASRFKRWIRQIKKPE